MEWVKGLPTWGKVALIVVAILLVLLVLGFVPMWSSTGTS